MTKLLRAANQQQARECYIEALIKKFDSPKYPEKMLRDIFRLLVEKAWPKLRRLESPGDTWRYIVSAGPMAAELSGILGGDLNLHCGKAATLSTNGLIGISGAAIAADIGGTLLDITSVSYRQGLSPGEDVLIEIKLLSQKRRLGTYTMTGVVVKTGTELFREAQITMMDQAAN